MLEHQAYIRSSRVVLLCGGVIQRPSSQLHQRVHAPESVYCSIFLLLVNFIFVVDAANGAIRWPIPADRPATDSGLGAFIGQLDWRDGQGLPDPQAEATESLALTLGT